jgi:hypothetical protein
VENLKSKLASHLAACTAAAIAACSASAANAAVVYSGVVNFAAAIDIDGTYINVETAQLTNGPGAGVPGWDVNPYRSSTGSGMNFFSPTGGGMVSAAAGTGPAINLASDTLIGSTSNFSSSTATIAFGSAAGQWQYGTNNIVGFRFVSSAGTTHYGWMRFLMGTQPASGNLVARTVVDFGFEDQTGVAILAGDTGALVSSVPGPLPLFGATAAFGWSRRLRRRTLQASKQSAPDTTLA